LVFFALLFSCVFCYRTVTSPQGTVSFGPSESKDLLIIPSNNLGTIVFTVSFNQTGGAWYSCNFYVYHGDQILQTNPIISFTVQSPQSLVYTGPSVFISNNPGGGYQQCGYNVVVQYWTSEICPQSVNADQGSLSFFSPSYNCAFSITTPEGSGHKLSYSTTNLNQATLFDGASGPVLPPQGNTSLSSLYVSLGSTNPSSNRTAYFVTVVTLNWTTVSCPGSICSVVRYLMRNPQIKTNEDGNILPFSQNGGSPSFVINFSRKASEILFTLNQNTGYATLVYPMSMYQDMISWIRDCRDISGNNNRIQLTSFIPLTGKPTFEMTCG